MIVQGLAGGRQIPPPDGLQHPPVGGGQIPDVARDLPVGGLDGQEHDYQPNKGCTVALLSPKDAYEVFFLRGNLEKLALQKGGCHINDQGIFIMETALEEMQALASR